MGKGVFIVGKEQFELSNGQMIFAAIGEVRAIKSIEKLVLIVFMTYIRHQLKAN